MPQVTQAAQAAQDKFTARRKLVWRCIDLAYAREDQIMFGTKMTTGLGLIVADVFSGGGATVGVKSVEGAAMASVRAVRKSQARALYNVVTIMSSDKLKGLIATMPAGEDSEVGFAWLRSRVTYANAVAGPAAGAAAAGGGAAAAAVGAALGEVFVDYLGNEAVDQLLSIAPFGVGAVKSGVQLGLVTDRIADLKKEIKALKIAAA